MSGTSKPDLARAGTMQKTAEEAAVFLDKTLTEWKKPYLMNTDREAETEGDEEEEEEEEEEEDNYAMEEGEGDEENADEDADGEEETESDETPRLAKYSTMKETAEEGEEYLKDQGRPNEDAVTRGQQRKLDEIYAEEEPAAKAPRLAKANTMTETVVAGKAFIAHRRRRLTELCQVKKEAEAVYGKIHMTEGIWMRKRMARAKMAKLNQEETLTETITAEQHQSLLQMMKMRRHVSRKSPQRKIAARGRHPSRAACKSRTKRKHLSKSASVRCRSKTQGRKSVSTVAKNRSRSPSRRNKSPAKRIASSTNRIASLPRRIVSPGKRSASQPRRSVSPGKRSASPGKRSVSPGKRIASPPRRSASPGKRSASPPRRSTSPGMRRASQGKWRKLRAYRMRSGNRRVQGVQSQNAKSKGYRRR